MPIDRKKNNARVMKWRQMLKQGLFSNPKLLISRTRKGIPSSIRMEVWPEIIKIDTIIQNKPLTYSKVLIKQSYDVYDIKLDIPRFTYFFISCSKSSINIIPLNWVLSRYEFLSDEITITSYGLNNFLYLLPPNKETSFHMYLLTYKDDNLKNPGYVSTQNEVFTQLLAKYQPKIAEKLRSHSIQPVMYTTPWFLTLFSKTLSKSKFYRLFECVLVEGQVVMYKAGLALLKLKQKELMANNMQTNMGFINDIEWYNKYSDDQLMEKTFQYEIEMNEVEVIENEYRKKNKKMLQRLDGISKENYLKKIKEPRNQCEWTIQQFQDMETSLVKFDEE